MNAPNITRAVRLVLFAFIIFYLRSVAYGCSCGPTPTVLDSLERSDVVATMKFVDVESVGPLGEIKSVRLTVTKVYKGDVSVGQKLSFAQGEGADCIWQWDNTKAGSEYLLYLGKPSQTHPLFGDDNVRPDAPLLYYVIGCGRSRSIERAQDDLNFLNNLDKLAGKTRLSGTFRSWVAEPKDFANVTLRVTGKTKSYTLRTDKNGFYEIYDLPPGDYIVRTQIPFGWRYNDYMIDRSPSLTRASPYIPVKYAPNYGIPITIEKGRHASLDIWLERSAQISGTVIGLDGKPVERACLTAVSIELKEGDYRGSSDCTDERGRFMIQRLDPDRYRLVIDNANGLVPNGSTKYVFFPGTIRSRDAAIIRVDVGRKIRGLVVRLPKELQTFTVSGQLFYSNGQAVPGGLIRFVPDDKTQPAQARGTAVDGSFSFQIGYGVTGRLFAEQTTFAGEFENCPAVDSLVAGRSGKVDLRSKEVHLTVTGPVPDARIEFPFPFCSKRK